MRVRLSGILLFFFCLSLAANAQQDKGYIDISRIKLYYIVKDSCRSVYIDKNADLAGGYSQLKFIDGILFHGHVPNEEVNSKMVIQVKLGNSSDSTQSAYVFPGFYVPMLQLFRDSAGKLVRLPAILPAGRNNVSYRKVSLAAHDSMTLLVELSFLKTYNNKVKLRFIEPTFLDYFMVAVRNTNSESDITSYVFCGLLLMMILFSFVSYFQGGRTEYLYYAGYAFFTGVMLLLKAALNYRDLSFNFFIEEYLDFILQCIGLIFYMLFMQLFLETREKFPFLYRLYKCGTIMLVISIVTYSFFHYATDKFPVENAIENFTKILLMGMVITFLVYSVRNWEERLLRYLFWGNLLFLLFSVLSFLLILLPDRLGLPGFFNNSLLYYEMGLFCELGFFLTALNYKNRKQIIRETREREILKAQNILKEYEKEMAVYKAQQEERQRISADMHDELGSGMTAIRLMSEIAMDKMKDQTPVELERISHSANDVLNKMNAIIWSMNSSNDTLGSLIAYIRSYATEFFDNTPVYCKVNAPDLHESDEISGMKRRNIFLCVKESLNNIIKHSKATRVEITISVDKLLQVVITDNGIGIDLESPAAFRNGLKNMRNRMESIGGTLRIRSEQGTITTLRLPL